MQAIGPGTGATATDESLMLRVQGDERGALDRLYRRHSASARRVALSVCHDEGRAQDVVQEAFISIWRGREGYRSTGSFKGWLFRSVRNRALDCVRNESAQKRPPAAQHDSPPERDPKSQTPLEDMIAKGERDALRTSLEVLPGPQSAIIELAFFGGLTHEAIAEQLDLPMGTVKGRMRLGLEKMRRQVERSSEFEDRPATSREVIRRR